MKGIVLAGGLGTRLYPSTLASSKQLLPVYDKPMIYYPISVLMLAGIREILVITREEDQNDFIQLLGDGTQYGISFSFLTQKKPLGIAEAFLIAEDFIDNKPICLILGDNIFFGQNFSNTMKAIVKSFESDEANASIFAYPVSKPERFGVVDFNQDLLALSIAEKPNLSLEQNKKYKHAIPGLYFYSKDVVNVAKKVFKNTNSECGITEINQYYLDKNQLKLYLLGRGFTWLDTGTPDSLLEASQFVQTIEHRQGLKVACLEEIAWRNNWISHSEVKDRANSLFKNTNYGGYLLSFLKNSI